MPPVTINDEFNEVFKRLRRLEGRTNGGGPSGQGTPGTNGISSGFTFSWQDTLEVAVGNQRLYIGQVCNITNVIASVGVAPIGSDIRIDVNKNGSTIFTTQETRPTIVDGTFVDTLSDPQIKPLALNDYLTIDIDLIGSTFPGAGLVVQVMVA